MTNNSLELRPANENGVNCGTCRGAWIGGRSQTLCYRAFCERPETAPLADYSVGDDATRVVCDRYAFGRPKQSRHAPSRHFAHAQFLEQRQRLVHLLGRPDTTSERRRHVLAWLAQPLPPAP